MSAGKIEPGNDTFANWLDKFRTATGRDWTKARLAKEMRVSFPMLLRYLDGELPRRRKLFEIVQSLQVEGKDLRDLFEAYTMSLRGTRANQKSVMPQQDLRSDEVMGVLVGIIDEVINRRAAGDIGKAFLFKLEELLRVWLPAQKKREVTTAIVPIAGWQSELFSPGLLAELLGRAVKEAQRANIERVVAVVAPGVDRVLAREEQLVSLGKSSKIIFVVQNPKARGLGNAILKGAEHLELNYPFVLIFPDEFSQVDYLTKLLEMFREKHSSVLGLSNEKVKPGVELGVAYCPKGGTEEVRAIRRLKEKPRDVMEQKNEQSFPVLGRYVLTDAVIEQLKKEVGGSVPLGLTDALNNLARAGMLYGCLFSPEMRRLPSTEIKQNIRAWLDSLQ